MGDSNFRGHGGSFQHKVHDCTQQNYNTWYPAELQCVRVCVCVCGVWGVGGGGGGITSPSLALYHRHCNCRL